MNMPCRRYHRKRILVTGGAGFLGSHLIDRLLERGDDFLCVDNLFAEEYLAARPASERLITKKLDLRGLNMMRDWRTCLAEYLAEAYAGYLDRSDQPQG